MNNKKKKRNEVVWAKLKFLPNTWSKAIRGLWGTGEGSGHKLF
jgi:hypothetical protein